MPNAATKSRYAKITEQPQTFVFAPISPKRTQGKFGPQWEYAVNGDQILSVSDYVHDQIQAGWKNPATPYAVRIRRYKNDQNRTRYEFQDAAVPASTLQHATTQASRAERQQNQSFSDLAEDMAYCIQAAKAIVEMSLEGATTEDVRTIGTSLFIEANRRGMPIPRFNADDAEIVNDDEFPPEPDEDPF